MSTEVARTNLPQYKVAEQAQQFTQTLGRFTKLPQSAPKNNYIRYLAEDNKTDINFSIDRNNYQHAIYHHLQQQDYLQRNKFHTARIQKQKKIQNNQAELQKKRGKQVEALEKHLSEIYKKHTQIQKNKKMDKDTEAVKLRKELLEFYEKERQRKKSRDHKQIKVSTCYQDAVRRIDQIHKQNQLYAMQSQDQYLKRMKRNDGKERNLLYMTRMKSLDNKKKQQVYHLNEQIMEDNELKFVQTYCKDLQISKKAFQHKDKQSQKTKQRLTKFFKQRVEKWQGLKTRVEEQKAQIPRKCVNILDKTTKASFRHTVSTFKDSSKQWYNIVQNNKAIIYDDNDFKKDQIMEEHQDRTYRNMSRMTVNERMGSMRDRAKKLSAANSPIKGGRSTSFQFTA